MRDAILVALSPIEGLANAGLRAAVESNTPAKLWEEHAPGWYTTSVKLDLEARALLVASGSPQQLRLTKSGRVALSKVR